MRELVFVSRNRAAEKYRTNKSRPQRIKNQLYSWPSPVLQMFLDHKPYGCLEKHTMSVELRLDYVNNWFLQVNFLLTPLKILTRF